MNKLLTIVLGTLVAASASFAQTAPSAGTSAVFYAQPSAVIAFPGHFDTAGGGALALGVLIDHTHSVEVEGVGFKSRDGSFRVTFAPVLANYDYHFHVNKLSFKVGAGVGGTYEEANYYWFHEKQCAFTYAVRGGVAYDFSERVSLDASVTALHLHTTDITTSGNMALLQLGLTFRL